MSENEADIVDPTTTSNEAAGDTTVVADDAPFRLTLDVNIDTIGPCKKHVRVRIPRSNIDFFYESAIKELAASASVPGFRVGRVPAKLVGRRFRKELTDEVKQKLLVGSLEQLSEDYNLDPINEPNLDAEAIEIPDEGDFEYEFEVEVRPEFDMPSYDGLVIDRPVRDVTDEDVDAYLQQFLVQYGKRVPHEGPAEKDDSITAAVEFFHDGETIRRTPELTAQLKPVLRFRDAELSGFDELMAGVQADETRECEITISSEAESVAMRGETVKAVFHVHEVKRQELPELSKEFLQRVGVETVDELKDEVRKILERQVTYEQRQSARTQVLEKITESATWDLPEELVSKQVDNALYREKLEMQQAGFTTQQIRARENQLRQQSVTSTRQAMKEHFVLDKIAIENDIEVNPIEIDIEIQLMAAQSGESPRRLRARLEKSGVIENLEAQIRERKAVDVVLNNAVYKDVPMDRPEELDVEAVNVAICGSFGNTASAASEGNISAADDDASDGEE